MPDFNASPFLRGFTIYNYLTSADESVWAAGGLVSGLGTDFAIYKGPGRGAGRRGGRDALGASRPRGGLVAVNRLIEDAKASIVEFTPGREVIADDAASNLRRGPVY